jgi:hypothetical protein
MIRRYIGRDWLLADHLERIHAPLHLGAPADLGAAHLEIVRSDQELLEACYVDRGADPRVETPLGREFNRVHDADTVHWWINRNAERAPQVGDHTRVAARSAVALKRAAQSLRPLRALTYQGLVELLSGFCSDNATEIMALLEYVQWLRSIDPFAPSMLFTTRVWSQSGRIDRRPGPLRELDPSCPPELMSWVSSETALGFWGRTAPLAEELVPSEGDTRPYVAALLGEISDDGPHDYVEEVLEKVVRGFRDYFADLRKAIENVSMECNAALGRTVLAGDEAFWRMVIEELRGSDRTETETWDVKRTLEFWGLDGEERAGSEVKFCRRLAAFANTSGGALIVGLSEECGLRVTGLTDVDAKVEATRHAIHSRTTLDPSQVKIIPVSIELEGGQEAGCIVIAVPSTKEPVSVRGPGSETVWPIRVDSRTRYSTLEAVKARKLQLAVDDYSFTDSLHRAFRGEEDRRLLSDY